MGITQKTVKLRLLDNFNVFHVQQILDDLKIYTSIGREGGIPPQVNQLSPFFFGNSHC